MITQEFKAKEHSLKVFDALEYAKSGRYLRKLNEELDYLEKQQKELEKRIKFLKHEKGKAIQYRLTH